ncbi:organic cation transporter protein [Tribolium castaneum]|uniref:Organic cation transporter protein-like Protein n=1 Tax=Tribolium castaneum TaxID=7070 RepID=D6WH07_TRICA|nr:PREDICTED: organic cation transporter protein [Tribolium castaneum]XP_008190946.1 PREDICTED: organic cation transporter protein [Tribolium castaneum]XP_015833282.1 PREDICTED: organic cation transporter protein [Tribolium castaneum]EFA00131.1 Organic cation transporter protein-like Protein [Tribolium castaneum]|eukprot:XP_008190945.1 PREDICTED: organic cation transporter protein [Tribolium castaneum]
MGYDDVIPLIGDFGGYQKRIYFLLCLPAILCAFHKLGNVFLIAEPAYRCKLPSEFSNATYQDLSPEEMNKSYPWDSLKKNFSSCEMFVGNATKRCDEFVYDESVYGYTAVIEWELTCEKAYMIATGNSLFMVGVMLGSIIFGQLSDKYGRKKIFFASLIIQVFFGLIAAFTPEFWSFTLSRAIVGATTSGVFLVAYVIALEMVSPKKRLLAGTCCQMFFSTGYMLTALFAIYIHEWRDLQLALTLPGLVFFCYWWLIPESSRWLINQNRVEEAKVLIKIAAKKNKIKITDEQLDSLLVSEVRPENHNAHKANVLDIFRHSNLRKRSLIILFDWFANNITYYGLSWNTNNLAGNPYINFVISGAVEIPAYTFLLFTLNRWGRKFVMCGCMIFAGVALLLTMAIPDEHEWLVVTCAMLGKLAITASYGAIYIFSTEQFPTVIRNAGLGAGSTCARIGSITSPYINVLSKFWTPLPLIIFGSLALIGGVMSLVLPETLNKKLPETMEEGEAFGKKVKKERTKEEVPLNGNDLEKQAKVETNGGIQPN